jgi:hypothetical protein
MSGIPSVAPQQPFTPPQPTTQPTRTASSTPPDQESSGAPTPTPTTPNGRLVNLTA